MKNVYVLALTGDAIAPFTVAGRRVEFVQLSGFYAAIERRAERLLVSESSLRTQHDIVTRLSDRIDAVVPARFGASIEESELRDILADTARGHSGSPGPGSRARADDRTISRSAGFDGRAESVPRLHG